MELKFTIDKDISPARLEEYKKLLNEMLGYDAKWEAVEDEVPLGLPNLETKNET